MNAGSLGWLGVGGREELAWILVGLAGQAFFFLRFAMQWIASERARRSVIPVAFWWLSIGGAAMLLAYAIWRADPVFVVGQVMGLAVYVRNLMLIRLERRDRAAAAMPGRARGER